MRLPNVIAVCAPSRRSGKGTISDVLINEFGYTEYMFAGPIKVMWTALCMVVGMDKDTVNRTLFGDLKEVPMEQLGGMSLRSFAESIGTKWGRDMISPTLWVNIGSYAIWSMLDKGKRVVVSDARYPNEANLVRDMGGVVVNVIRPVENGGLEPTLASEGHLRDYRFDATFVNDSTVVDLQAVVRNWMREENVLA